MRPDFVPMLATQTQASKTYDDGRYAAEGKFDGFRLVAWREVIPEASVDRIRLFGRPQRNGAAADYTGHLAAYLDPALMSLLPPDTCVDGEVISPRGRSHVQSVMFTAQPHVPSDRSPALQLVMFDVLRDHGRDVRREPWTDRRGRLEGLGEGEHVGRSPLLPAADALETALSAGLEGVVYKRRDSRYVNGRSSAWSKDKPQQTCEARVVGFEPGKVGGQWDGKVGAFVVELLDSGVRTTVKCGTNPRHEEASAHPERWLGAIIEMGHHGILESGCPLHPVFKARRDDLLRLDSAA